jgi:hypothetical protein
MRFLDVAKFSPSKERVVKNKNFVYTAFMAKRMSVNTKNKATRSKKTKKRLATKAAMITAKKAKKK